MNVLKVLKNNQFRKGNNEGSKSKIYYLNVSKKSLTKI